MKLYDLTDGHYCDFNKIEYEMHIKQAIKDVRLPYLSYFQFLQNDDNYRSNMESLINATPIFIVESSMAKQTISVPRRHFSVLVPEDNYKSQNSIIEFNHDRRRYSEDYDYGNNNDNYNRGHDIIINDFLGVYIHRDKDEIFPKRIFIWIDKIEEYAKHNAQSSSYIEDAKLLLDIVFFHEIAHALMDVECYRENYSSYSYSNIDIFRDIEEALANCFALTITFFKDCFGNVVEYQHQKHNLSSAESFIKKFISIQGSGYSDGWELYEQRFFYLFKIDQWMCMKLLFNHDFSHIISESWKKKGFDILDFVKKIGHNEWLVIKLNEDIYGIVDRTTKEIIHYFDKSEYDVFIN